MKSRIISFGLAALAMTACSQSRPAGELTSARAAVGTFKSETQENFSEDVGQGRFAMVFTEEFLTIGSQSVTLRRTCQVDDNVTVVEETVPAEVNDTHFVLARPIQKEVIIGKFKCAIKRGAGVWGYSVDDKYLTLQGSDGTSESYGYVAGQKPTTLDWMKNKGAAVGRYLGKALTQDAETASKF